MSAALTLVGVALSSCASSALPPPVSVALVQQRGDIAPGRVQLRVTNDGGSPVVVTSATLTSPVLTQPGGGETKRPVTLSPGRTVDLPVKLPALGCVTGDPSAQAVLRVEEDGSAHEETLSVTDELGVLARLTATECDREAVASVARISVVSAAAGADGTIDLEVSIEPTGEGGAGSVDLRALRGTPLLRFPAGTETPLDVTVRADDPPSTMTIALTPQRCDAHAIAEDKVGTLLDLVARVEDRDAVVPLERSPSVAAAILSATADVCGLTP
ncbi:MAG: hypothetical protein K0R81_98 [Microbacterium sp.]|nr:hypothetical protein [Microbacterium sp.]